MKFEEITSLSLGKQQMDFQTSDLLFHESRYASWLKTVRGVGEGGDWKSTVDAALYLHSIPRWDRLRLCGASPPRMGPMGKMTFKSSRYPGAFAQIHRTVALIRLQFPITSTFSFFLTVLAIRVLPLHYLNENALSRPLSAQSGPSLRGLRSGSLPHQTHQRQMFGPSLAFQVPALPPLFLP